MGTKIRADLLNERLNIKPNYLDNDDFLDFLDDSLAKVYKDEGFIFIMLDKDYYLPGEILKGSIFF